MARIQKEMTMETLPDTPSSVLELFSTSKDSIIVFSDQVIDEIREGRADVLRVKALCKSMEIIADRIDKNTRSEQERAAALHGEKPFMLAGAEMHYTPTYTKYDYTVCGDPVWNTMKLNLAELNEMIANRETFLRGIQGKEILTDKDTGETCEVFPPLRKQTMGVKVTIK